jgi:hypothetical protein
LEGPGSCATVVGAAWSDGGWVFYSVDSDLATSHQRINRVLGGTNSSIAPWGPWPASETPLSRVEFDRWTKVHNASLKIAEDVARLAAQLASRDNRNHERLRRTANHAKDPLCGLPITSGSTYRPFGMSVQDPTLAPTTYGWNPRRVRLNGALVRRASESLARELLALHWWESQLAGRVWHG